MNNNLKLPFGLRGDQLVHISEITKELNGLKCGCVCPSCKQELEARTLGTKKKPYFAHAKSECSYGYQTALHLFVKEILEESVEIKLPAVYYIDDTEKAAAYLKYDSVVTERKLGGIIPDIIITKGNSQLLIEVTVTHGLDDEKLYKIKQLSLSCLEIDMTCIEDNYQEFDREKVKHVIIHNTDFKYWVYNRSREEYTNQLKKNYEEHQQQKNKKEKERLQRIQALQEKDAQKKIVKGMYDKISSDSTWIVVSKKLDINLNNVPYYMNVPIKGEMAFNCHRIVWQSAIFKSWIYNRITESGGKTFLSVKFIHDWIKTNSSLNINRDLEFTKDLENEFGINIPSLSDVIADYLAYLVDYGYLKLANGNYMNNNKFFWAFHRLRENLDIYPPEFNNENYRLLDGQIITLEEVKNKQREDEEKQQSYYKIQACLNSGRYKFIGDTLVDIGTGEIVIYGN